jgi:hypothetical protein
MIDYPESH